MRRERILPLAIGAIMLSMLVAIAILFGSSSSEKRSNANSGAADTLYPFALDWDDMTADQRQAAALPARQAPGVVVWQQGDRRVKETWDILWAATQGDPRPAPERRFEERLIDGRWLKEGREIIVDPNWHVNGVVRVDQQWHRGAEHGITTRRDEYGRVLTQQRYENGKLVETRDWRDGEPGDWEPW